MALSYCLMTFVSTWKDFISCRAGVVVMNSASTYLGNKTILTGIEFLQFKKPQNFKYELSVLCELPFT